MSWAAPKTWTAVIVTVADLNQHIRDNLLILKTSIANDGAIVGPLRGYAETSQAVSIVSGVVSVDLAAGNHVVVTLTANITSFTLTSSALSLATANAVFPVVLYLLNNGTVRTITWTVNGNGVHFGGGVAPTMTGTNGKYDIVVLTYCTGAGLFVFGDVKGQNY